MSPTLRLTRGILAATLALALTAGISPVAAASCKGASHHASLTNGAVSPGSGDTSTLFKFKVRYSDNASCAPASVTVSISGVGDLAMSSVGGSGTSYQRETKLPTGSFSYSFTAVSGQGAGYQVVTLSAVSPSKLTVNPPQPAPTATPKPTPAPTVAPTKPPKPAATPVPTPVQTKAPVQQPTPDAATLPPTVPPSPSSQASVAPKHSEATHSPRPVAAVTGEGTPPRTDGGVLALADDQPSLPWLLAWLVATAGGLVLFFVLGRQPELGFAAAGPADDEPPQPASPVQGDGATARRARRQLGDESQLPRWLRPSVQAARYATPGRSGPDD